MTTVAESPFKSDSTPSNKCGFTLMNNQVGEIVARVMATKPNVTVMWLPSMMRVDAIGRMDVIYDEISEAAGEDWTIRLPHTKRHRFPVGPRLRFQGYALASPAQIRTQRL